MPLTPVQLVGGSYTSRARSLDLSQSVNVLYRAQRRQETRHINWHARAASLDDAARIGPCVGCIPRQALGCLLWLARTFYELFPNQTLLPRGKLVTTSGIVTFADDGQNVVAVDGQKGYVFDLAAGSTFAHITDPDWKPASPCGVHQWHHGI